MTNPAYKKRENNRGGKLIDYWPLVSLILIAILASYAITYSVNGNITQCMHYFMGFFLCCFAMLKIFNLSAFADGFEMYDIIAKQIRSYAYLYPFIELLLGLSLLAFIIPMVVYIFTIIIMSIGTIGVISALKKNLDINCPCMGSILEVPLSTVTLTEDLGMIAMSVIMLIMRYF
jgi:mannose/fructose/N-acetylgalactosamine-specific phosphotransferase system component IID